MILHSTKLSPTKSSLKHNSSRSASELLVGEAEDEMASIEGETKKEKLNRLREIASLLGVLIHDNVATAVEDFEALRDHSKLRKTNPGTILPKEEIELALHFMKFASASYGWKLVYGLDTSKNLRMFKCLAKTAKANDDVICYHTGVKKEDILMRTAKTNGMIPGFYLAIDHSSKSLVLAIRGTQTISDTLTDLVATSHPFLNEWVHKGMYFSALALQMKIQQKVTETFEKHPDYKMVFVGHSLGAGIATILTLMYRDEDPNAPVFCFAFAPPCTVSKGLAIKGRSFIRSYIYGDDVIPRLTYNSIQQIRARCAIRIRSRKKTITKRRLVMSRCLNSSTSNVYPPSLHEHDRASASTSDSQEAVSDDVLSKSPNMRRRPNTSKNYSDDDNFDDTSVLQDELEDFVADSECVTPRKGEATTNDRTSLATTSTTTTTTTTRSTNCSVEIRINDSSEPVAKEDEKKAAADDELVEAAAEDDGAEIRDAFDLDQTGAQKDDNTDVKVPQVDEDIGELEEKLEEDETISEKEAQTLFPAGVIYHMILTSHPLNQETTSATELNLESTSSEINDANKLDEVPPVDVKKNHWWQKKKQMIKTTEMMFWELEHITFSFNMFTHHLPPFYEYAFKRLLHQAQVQEAHDKPKTPTFSQRFFASIPRWR